MGAGALDLNTADNNTAVGVAALLLNTTGTNNTASGVGTLVFNNNGEENTATGAFAMYSNTEGDFNTANGGFALYFNTTGERNTAIGDSAPRTGESLPRGPELGRAGLGQTRGRGRSRRSSIAYSRERLEVERAAVAAAGAEVGRRRRAPAARAGDEERVAARRLEQVLDEVEQARVRPLHVLEGEDCRVRLGEPLEEEPPRAEEFLPLARLVVAEPEQLREPRLDECSVVGIEQVLLERRMQLLERCSGLVVFGDPAAHPHHVGERPVGDALAVGKTPAAMPVGRSARCRRSTCRTPTKVAI